MSQERFVLIQVEPDPAQQFPLVNSLTLGRVGCDVPLDDPQASRHHAQITVRDGRVMVEDLGSSNGTFVAGQRIDSPTELDPADSMRIGNTVWRVEGAPDREPPPPPPPPRAEDALPPPVAPPDPAPPPPVAPPASAPAPAPAPAPAVPPAPAGAGFSVAPARRTVSAARRVEATLVCYAVIIATAVAVIAYLAAR